jgi:hypothetical protein
MYIYIYRHPHTIKGQGVEIWVGSKEVEEKGSDEGKDRVEIWVGTYLRDAVNNLPYEISSYISCFGVNATTNTTE